MRGQTKSAQQKKGGERACKNDNGFFVYIVSWNPKDFQSWTVTRKLLHAAIALNNSGIKQQVAPIVQTPVKVPFFNISALPADSTCRNCVLSQPPDQNCANKPTAFTTAGERCCGHTNSWRNKAGRHRFYILFCICTAARQNEPCKEFMLSFGEFQNAHVQTAPAELCSRCCKQTGITFPLFQLPHLGTFWDLDSASPSLMAVSQPRPQFRLGTQAAVLTLGKVSCPTRSWRCLMVLKAKVLMAKGSHRIIDKSLRRSKN